MVVRPNRSIWSRQYSSIFLFVVNMQWNNDSQTSQRGLCGKRTMWLTRFTTEEMFPSLYKMVYLRTTKSIKHGICIRVTMKLLTPPPPAPEWKRKIYSSTWDSVILRGLLWRLNPSLDRFQPRLEERKKVNFEKEPQSRPFTVINFPSSQNSHSLRAFSQFWEKGRIAGG